MKDFLYRNTVWVAWYVWAVVLWPIILIAHVNTFVSRLYYPFMYSFIWGIMSSIGEQERRKRLFSTLQEEQNRAKSRGENIRILEVGVATGRNFYYYPEGAVVSTIDLYPSLDESAVEKKCSHLSFNGHHCASIEDLKKQFPDNSFDVVVAIHVLCYVKNKEKAMKEVRRVLKAGGKLYCWEKVMFDPKKDPIKYLIQVLNLPIYRFVSTSWWMDSGEDYMKQNGLDTSGITYEVEPKMPLPFSRHMLGVAVNRK